MDVFRRCGALLLLVSVFSVAAADEGADDNAPSMGAETFKGLELRGIGPALMSGRIADIAVHPRRQSTWYVAVGSGGVWKTTNAGTTWKPIFEDQGSYSIGCVTLDPQNPEVVWVGTGENVGGRHVGYGDGAYRSRDGGETFERVGLAKSEHIGKILVHPADPDVVLVAAQGPLWSAGGERGLFKTTDGGKTWKKTLGDDEYTGVTDVVMDPRDPDVLYASTHQRVRTVAALLNGGAGSGIHKSTDGGETWRRVTEGLPEEDMGRIGLAVSPIDPDIVYATIELAHRKGGFWRSADSGETWKKQSAEIAGATGPHYYQEIFASPHKLDRVYMTDMELKVTEDGGKTFAVADGKFKHVDNHAMAFDPDDPEYLLVGCDGGIYETWDLGKKWRFAANLPVTQFYKVAVDYELPFYNVYGGTQDNNTQGGPSRTDNVHGIRNSDWFITLWGDGHQPAVDPTNPDIVYSEWQQGNLARFDRNTGEFIYIQPQPAEGEPYDRFNWDAPILVSPHDPKTLYYASQRVWRSDDHGDSWRAISDDLTRDLDRLTLPMMGRVMSIDSIWDLYAMSEYSTITSLAESRVEPGLIYAGTDDGLIQVTEDGGGTWRKIDALPGVPDKFFVNDLKADLYDADTVYACVDQHKTGDFAPYLYKSTDRGRTWTSMVGDLPERHLVWRIVQDHEKLDLFFLGTEMGVFFTVDGGSHWIKLVGGMPNIPVRDLVIQVRENDLVCATFGRSFYVLDDYSALRHVSEDVVCQDAVLFPVRKAWSYLERNPLGFNKKASQGDAFFVAPNPKFGALFTYYLGEDLRSRKDARREREKSVAKENGDNPYPGWDEIKKEELEDAPLVILTVRDAEGRVVRRVTGPAKAGFHRVAWDLRHPATTPWHPKDKKEETEPKDDADEEEDDKDEGHLAPPGRYTVTLATRVDGLTTVHGEPETFDVDRMDKGATLRACPAEDREVFQAHLATVERGFHDAVGTIADAKTALKGMRGAILRSNADASLDDAAKALEDRLSALQERLSGNSRRQMMGAEGPISVERRIDVASMGTRMSRHGPTPTHQESLRIAVTAMGAIREAIRQIVGDDVPALEKRLDEAGVRWSPGRR